MNEIKRVHNSLPVLLPDIVIERARKLSPALLCEGMREMGVPKEGAMEPFLAPVNPASPMMVGTAITVDTDNGDTLPIQVATYSAKSGYVLVVDGKGYTRRPYFGRLTAHAAQTLGLEGIVLDGYVRDGDDIAALNFPVFSKGFLPRSVAKKDPGNINVPIQCGGINVTPGDLVVGNSDGVVVVPRNIVCEVLEKAEEMVAYEDARTAVIKEYALRGKEGTSPLELAPQWVLDTIAKMQ